MRIVKTKSAVAAAVAGWRAAGNRVGFVPTMGALHEGHLSLVRASVADNDRTVISIFVNPAQFDPGEDLGTYPRDLEGDCQKAREAGADLVYTGTVDDLYPDGFATYVIQERLTERLCGEARPVFFRGVLTIVLKLFNIVRPDAAYFGQKDAQQAAVVARMARDLDTGVAVRVLPTVREPDGLAMSSRNAYLDARQRAAAPILHRALCEAIEAVNAGMRQADEITGLVRKRVESEPRVKVEYVELVDCEDLAPLPVLEHRGLLALAARIGETRLIDNAILQA